MNRVLIRYNGEPVYVWAIVLWDGIFWKYLQILRYLFWSHLPRPEAQQLVCCPPRQWAALCLPPYSDGGGDGDDQGDHDDHDDRDDYEEYGRWSCQDHSSKVNHRHYSVINNGQQIDYLAILQSCILNYQGDDDDTISPRSQGWVQLMMFAKTMTTMSGLFKTKTTISRLFKTKMTF